MERISRSQWNRRTAAHLLARAGFGPTDEEIERASLMAPEEVVDELLAFGDEEERFLAPAWALAPDAAARPLDLVEAEGKPAAEVRQLLKTLQRTEREHVHELRHGWLARMLATRHPLREKLTLFWHGHFTTSGRKVMSAYSLWCQNRTLRRHAAGNFTALTAALARDPAMLFYLDNARSRAEHPNENFARELLELFTLGVGNYTEEDVLAAARALTGWTIRRERIEFTFDRERHDGGEKRFLGRTGALDGDDVLAVLAESPAVGPFLVRKLWRFFAHEELPPALEARLVATFEREKRELAPLLRELFLAREFHAPHVIGSQIKSPVQWLVGTLRVLGAGLPELDVCVGALRALGQELYEPPSVKGWDGGASWITASTLVARFNYAGFLARGGALLRQSSPELARQVAEGARPAAEAEHEGRIALALARLEPVLSPERILPEAARADRARALAHLEWLFFRTTLEEGERAALRAWLAELPAPAEWSAEETRAVAHLLLANARYQLT